MSPRPFRSFVVSCEDPDSVGDYRFDVTDVGQASVTLRERYAAGDLLETIDFTFAADAFDTAAGLLSMTQSNDVTHEDDSVNRSWDGRHTRSVRLVDSTPPFVLSRRLARVASSAGRIDGLRFFDFLGPMAPLVRDGHVERRLDVGGRSTVLRAERYTGSYGCELLLVRTLEPFGEVNLVLRAARDDEFAVTLKSVD